MSASDDKKSASESESFAISDAYIPTSRESLPVDKTDQEFDEANHAVWWVAIYPWCGICLLCLAIFVSSQLASRYDYLPNFLTYIFALLTPLMILAIATAVILKGTWKCMLLFFSKNRIKTSMPLIFGICGNAIAWVVLCYAINGVYYYSPFGDYVEGRSSL